MHTQLFHNLHLDLTLELLQKFFPKDPQNVFGFGTNPESNKIGLFGLNLSTESSRLFDTNPKLENIKTCGTKRDGDTLKDENELKKSKQ